MSAVMGRLDSDLLQPEFVTMQVDDLDAVMAIERRIYEFPWTRGNFEDSLSSGYDAWLMREGARMLGYAVMMLVLDEAHLLNISIIPEQQHSGRGSAMLKYLLDFATEREVVRMLLEVRPSNASALAFYKHHGFVQVGERPDYYPARQGRETAWVLERTL
ncbi:MAG: ribosomal protein S18-alanine N-acetyltransferase [Betaproteobacteria bacterium]|nr:ribosomal protein S18-alanine N-acetyltransferase [Betaproteobacteria bacterium]